MTRGYPPIVAIAEAMHHAERIGYLVSWVNSKTLACDFMAINEGQIMLVWVRNNPCRNRHTGNRVGNILIHEGKVKYEKSLCTKFSENITVLTFQQILRGTSLPVS